MKTHTVIHTLKKTYLNSLSSNSTSRSNMKSKYNSIIDIANNRKSLIKHLTTTTRKRNVLIEAQKMHKIKKKNLVK